ncbi:MAG: type II secretion system F family protein [Pirellulales bacterium]
MFSNTNVWIPIGLAVWAMITMGLFVFGSEWGKKKDGEGDPNDPNKLPNDLFEDGPSRAPDKRVVTANEERRNKLAERLVQAGLYRRNSSMFYYIAQAILATIPTVAGLILMYFGILGIRGAALGGIITGIGAVLFPGLYLDNRISKRQLEIRSALPDALDVLVISLEAGLSLPASLVRLAKEMSTSYPLLAVELTIVHREIQLGASTGGALRNFADRFALEELRSLSSVVMQAERYGASVVQALRVHAETLRIKRLQAAQEKAQKATVKLLIPTVLCIFPAMFVVILGPAAFRIMSFMSKMPSSGAR